MKLPKQIYFASETYKIVLVKHLDCYGETDSGSKTIKIKKGMSNRQIRRTLIHELLHVIVFESDLHLKHKQIYKLEQYIDELLMDNFL